MIPFVILFMLFAMGFLIFSLEIENYFLVYLSSVIFLLTGLFTYSNGIVGVYNWFTSSIATFYVAIGMYVGVTTSLHLIKESEEY